MVERFDLNKIEVFEEKGRLVKLIYDLNSIGIYEGDIGIVISKSVNPFIFEKVDMNLEMLYEIWFCNMNKSFLLSNNNFIFLNNV
jgi:hypothetical protein